MIYAFLWKYILHLKEYLWYFLLLHVLSGWDIGIMQVVLANEEQIV
jgi:hypothetical protein